jgi:branched-chain amino acid transport system ATP-binding protein
MTLLAVENLGKAFGGVRAIEALSFEVRRGSVHSIIGPNGAGKTTLLNMLTGVYVPDSGRILLDGRDLTGLGPHRFAAAGIGRTFQNLQIFFNMTALENVMTGRHLRETDSLLACLLRTPARVRAEHARRDAARALLLRVGLGAWLDSAADSVRRAQAPGDRARWPLSRACCCLTSRPCLNQTEARERSTR